MDIPSCERRTDTVTSLVIDQILLSRSALDVDSARRYAHTVGADPEVVAEVLRRPPDSLRRPTSPVISSWRA